MSNAKLRATFSYIAEKNNLRQLLEAEKHEEANLTNELDRKGKLIIEMKTSLQQINQLLSSVGKCCGFQKLFWEISTCSARATLPGAQW